MEDNDTLIQYAKSKFNRIRLPQAAKGRGSNGPHGYLMLSNGNNEWEPLSPGGAGAPSAAHSLLSPTFSSFHVGLRPLFATNKLAQICLKLCGKEGKCSGTYTKFY